MPMRRRVWLMNVLYLNSRIHLPALNTWSGSGVSEKSIDIYPASRIVTSILVWHIFIRKNLRKAFRSLAESEKNTILWTQAEKNSRWFWKTTDWFAEKKGIREAYSVFLNGKPIGWYQRNILYNLGGTYFSTGQYELAKTWEHLLNDINRTTSKPTMVYLAVMNILASQKVAKRWNKIFTGLK